MLGPDLNRMCVLPAGSVFGILDKSGRGRQTLTMVAKGHVELLSCSSDQFHSILSNYHDLQKQFIASTHINVDYIAGGPLSRMQRQPHKGLLVE